MLTVDLEALDVWELAQLYVILGSADQTDAARDIELAGWANCGKDDWQLEVISARHDREHVIRLHTRL